MNVILDSSVLGGVVTPNPKSPSVVAMISWAAHLRVAGHILAIPAISDYEVRRELLRSGSLTSVAVLDSFCHGRPNVYLSLTDAALRRAAALWAAARNQGQPGVRDAALDGDVILMAQVLEQNYGTGDYVIATDNQRHFQGIVAADDWRNIVP